MSVKKILKEAQKLEGEWREQQRAKETEIPERQSSTDVTHYEAEVQ